MEMELYNTTDKIKNIPKFNYSGSMSMKPHESVKIEDYMSSFFKPYARVGIVVRPIANLGRFSPEDYIEPEVSEIVNEDKTVEKLPDETEEKVSEEEVVEEVTEETETETETPEEIKEDEEVEVKEEETAEFETAEDVVEEVVEDTVEDVDEETPEVVEEVVEETVEEEKSEGKTEEELMAMSVKELRALAKEVKVSVYNFNKKADIVKALLDSKKV